MYTHLCRVVDILESEGARFTEGGLHRQRPALIRRWRNQYDSATVIAATSACQSFVFNCASFAAMNARISSDIFSSFSHCSLYKVTGKRPIP